MSLPRWKLLQVLINVRAEWFPFFEMKITTFYFQRFTAYLYGVCLKFFMSSKILVLQHGAYDSHRNSFFLMLRPLYIRQKLEIFHELEDFCLSKMEITWFHGLYKRRTRNFPTSIVNRERRTGGELEIFQNLSVYMRTKFGWGSTSFFGTTAHI